MFGVWQQRQWFSVGKGLWQVEIGVFGKVFGGYFVVLVDGMSYFGG